jgi:hypothetical protein
VCEQCGTAFTSSSYLKTHEKRHIEGSPLHVNNVENPLVYIIPLKHKNKFTLEQNRVHVNIAGKPSIGPVAFKDM